MKGPDLAARQWVVSSEELAAAGLSERQMGERVAAGFLFRKYRGVYSVGRPDLGYAGRCRAAWLACGPDAAVSHVAAAADWRFRRWAGPIHVSAPRGRKGHPGLVLHRPRTLDPADVVNRGGYRVTSVARTILDMAPGASVDAIGGWMHEAGVQGVFDPREVWAVLQRHQHVPGRRRVEAALALEVVLTRSGLEDAWLVISRRAGMPPVIGNDHVITEKGEEEVDFHYPSLGLVVEVDGGRYHSSRWRQRRDAEKTKRLQRAGLRVRRVPELEITLDADGLVARLRAMLAAPGPSNRPMASVGGPNA